MKYIPGMFKFLKIEKSLKLKIGTPDIHLHKLI